ncbi:MAG: winged helix-turn-helix domain-containing protein [Solirubrobacterales bacterium]
MEWSKVAAQRLEEAPLVPKSNSKLPTKPLEVIDQRLVKALGHPIRADVLSILNERVASPSELAKALGEGLSQVSYHVNVLIECDCLELVKTEPRRGAIEHYYRATSRAFLNAEEFALLPESIRPGMSATLLRAVIDDAASALSTHALDSREDRHLSWTPMIIDETGWNDLTAMLSESLDRTLEIQAESAERLTEAKGEDGFSVSVTLLGFPTPSAEQKSAAQKS